MNAYSDSKQSVAVPNVYRVQSSRHQHLWYRVAHDLRTDTFSCQCPAALHGRPTCRHIRAAQQQERAAQAGLWLAVLDDYDEAALRDLQTAREDYVRTGLADDDDRAVLAACAYHLARLGGQP